MKKILLLLLLAPLYFSSSAQDFSNKGKDFYLCFPSHLPSGSSLAQMYIYITSDQNSSGVITYNGSSQTFSVTQNTVTTIPINRALAYISDAESNTPVKKGIRVKVDDGKPSVVVYTEIYASARTEASLILPVSVLGRKYRATSYYQNSTGGSKSQFEIIAVEANTTVQIQLIKNGTISGTPFNIILPGVGDVYQIQDNLDLSGTYIESISSGTEPCKRIAVFSGSSALAINTVGCAGNSFDPLFQQCYPISSWGKNFGVIPIAGNPSGYQARVMASEDNTTVNYNGTTVVLNAGKVYPAIALNVTPQTQPIFITADKPVSVSQYLLSQNCSGGIGDPDMIILNPIEQNISNITIFTSTHQDIVNQYANILIPTAGAASFKINGTSVNGFVTMPGNPQFAYLSYLFPYGDNSYTLSSDSGFNAICYGLGSVETYGYSAGTNVRDLYNFITPINPYSISPDPVACTGTPIYFAVTLPFEPTSLYWDFHGFQTPNVTINTPAYDSTYLIAGKQVWRYKLPSQYFYSPVGSYPVTITAGTTSSEGCGNSYERDFTLNVYDPTTAKIGFTYTGCVSDSVSFRDSSTYLPGVYSYKWRWDFGDGTFDTLRNPKHKYLTAGTYTVKFSMITNVGCLSDTATKQVIITSVPLAKFGISAPVCDGKAINLIDSSSALAPGVLTKWYWDFGDGNSIVATTNANQVHTYSPYGNKTATLKVETSTGCQSILFSKLFYINPNPIPDFTMPSGICLPADSAHFFDASTIADGTQSGFSYLWHFGDPPSLAADSSFLKNPAHFYNNAGPFNIKLKVTSAAGCIDSTTKILSNVYPQAHADFTVNAENCFKDVTSFNSTSTGNGNTVTTWFWDFGDGSATGNGQTTTHTYTIPNTYTIKHWIKTDKGCTSDTMIKQVIINPLPAAKFGVSLPNCISKNITFSDSSTANAGAITIWKWDLGDGTFLTLNNNSPFTHAYATSGNYIVKLFVTTDKGCISDTLSKQIVIHPSPAANFTMSPVCLPAGISQFTDQSTIADGTQSTFTYRWDFGEPTSGPLNSSTLQNPQHLYSSVGPFTVTLIVTSGNGCEDTVRKQLTEVYPQPTADFTVAPENCMRDVTSFTDQSSGHGSTLTEWHWDFGDGQTSAAGPNTTHTYGAAGTYIVKLFTRTDKGCISDTMSKQVIIDPLPTAAFTNTTPLCATKTVTFTNASAANAGNITTWNWNLGDGTILSLNNSNPLTHTYAVTGPFTVKLSVETDKGCKSDTTVRPVVVNAQPVANFILPQVCLNDAFAQFLDSSYIADGTDSSFTYLWKFDDPSSGALNTSTQKNPRHKYNAARIYNDTLIITSTSGCVASTIKPFTVNGATPRADFTVLNSNGLCSNTNVQIKDSSTVDFGSLTKIEIYWDYVNNPGAFDIDVTPDINELYTHLYPNFQSPLTRVFSVHVKAYSGGSCVDEKIINVTVNATPKVQFNIIPDACFTATPYQITQAGETGGVPGTGVFTGTGITASGIFDPSAAGVGAHLLRYTYTSNKGCVDFAEQTINVVAPPVARFGYSLPACETRNVLFSDSSNTPAGTIATWTWDFGDGTPLLVRNSAATFAHIFASANTYTVKLTVTTSTGCNSSAYTTSVKINPEPVVDFSMSKSCLPNANALFSDLSTIADGTASQFTYAWTFGDLNSGANTSTQKNPSHIYTAGGPYTVLLQVTSGSGCVTIKQKTYTDIHPQPQAKFSSNISEVCEGATITFNDLSTGSDTTLKSWQWNFGDGIISTQQNPTPHVFTTAGNYTVQLAVINNNDCISSPFSLPVIIDAYPVVDAGPDRNVLEGGSITLEPIITGNNLTYLWSPGIYLSSTIIKNPVVSGVADQLYTLTVTAGIGCSKSDQVFVKVLKFPKIPNTFTPNNDGINDEWVIQYLETYPGNRVQVFNRYGQLVFESKGYTKPWDGTMNGKSLPFGTYYYIIEPGNGRKPITGYVTLIK